MSEEKNRVIDPEPKPGDRLDHALRPTHLANVIGQTQIKENLLILIEAAKQRGEALDHVIF